MKERLLLAVVGVALAASCAKQDTPTTFNHLVAVTFEVGSYGSFPTKGMADAIAATLPEALDLQLTNTSTGTAYTAQTGRAVEIPAGTYAVTGGYVPEATRSIYGTAIYLSHAPKVSVSQEVTITAGMGTCSPAADAITPCRDKQAAGRAVRTRTMFPPLACKVMRDIKVAVCAQSNRLRQRIAAAKK